MFGKDIFGKVLVNRLCTPEPLPAIAVISDTGFEAECKPIIEYATPERCVLIQLQREGCTFEGDSRSYIDLPITTVQLTNEGTEAEFQARVVAAV